MSRFRGGCRIAAVVIMLVSAATLSVGAGPPWSRFVDTGVPSYRPNLEATNWSGYTALGSGFRSVAADWAVPTSTCNSNADLVGAWVGLGGIAANAVEQTGIEVACSPGQPRYRAWFEMAPAPPVYLDVPVGPGDHISAAVRRHANRYTLAIADDTRNWTRKVSRAAVGDNVSAEVVVESPTAAFPRFGQFSFSRATVDGRSLSAFPAIALDVNNGNGVQSHTGPLTGGAFSVVYRRE